MLQKTICMKKSAYVQDCFHFCIKNFKFSPLYYFTVQQLSGVTVIRLINSSYLQWKISTWLFRPTSTTDVTNVYQHWYEHKYFYFLLEKYCYKHKYFYFYLSNSLSNYFYFYLSIDNPSYLYFYLCTNVNYFLQHWRYDSCRLKCTHTEENVAAVEEIWMHSSLQICGRWTAITSSQLITSRA